MLHGNDVADGKTDLEKTLEELELGWMMSGGYSPSGGGHPGATSRGSWIGWWTQGPRVDAAEGFNFPSSETGERYPFDGEQPQPPAPSDGHSSPPSTGRSKWQSEHASPLRAMAPSLPMMGTIARPASGSVHHHPNSALSPNPTKRIADR